MRVKWPIILRRVEGDSMSPALRTGNIIVGLGRFKLVKGDVVVAVHEGREIVKRVDKIREENVYLLGDNSVASTDSKNYGWLSLANVRAKVIWPKV